MIGESFYTFLSSVGYKTVHKDNGSYLRDGYYAIRSLSHKFLLYFC